ncbi:MAG: hypothetical protein EHM41_20260 [Chloroflexi bacterium]|nr:MAG: hypothetical protein EHM41_20260 [Chloroflexota bacterium]
MTRVDFYHNNLEQLPEWDAYMLAESGLPGPRGNLELAEAAVDLGTREHFMRWLHLPLAESPTNSPQELLVFCGVVGLGKLAAGGDLSVIERLRSYASDPRWRIREAVAFALQRIGRANRDLLLETTKRWIEGNRLEQRAVIAGLAEPDLLTDQRTARILLQYLNFLTSSLANAEDRKSEEFRVLRQALGYAWSVAVAALPQDGLSMMKPWLENDDKDISWVMKENLKKKRLAPYTDKLLVG